MRSLRIENKKSPDQSSENTLFCMRRWQCTVAKHVRRCSCGLRQAGEVSPGLDVHIQRQLVQSDMRSLCITVFVYLSVCLSTYLSVSNSLQTKVPANFDIRLSLRTPGGSVRANHTLLQLPLNGREEFEIAHLRGGSILSHQR
jgi:hypothetical protein